MEHDILEGPVLKDFIKELMPLFLCSYLLPLISTKNRLY